MSEYRKAFEYEEEKGITGFVLVFFIMLLTVELLLGAATIVQGYRALTDTPALSATVLAAGSAYLLLVLAASIALRKRFRLGATLAKVLLIVRVPILVPMQVALYASLTTLASGTAELRSPSAILFTRLIAPIGYVALFSIAWYAFFLKSKKVRQLCEATQKKS